MIYTYPNKDNPLDKSKNIPLLVYTFLVRTNTMFTYTGLPETIPQEELELMLQTWGSVVVTKHEDKLYAYNAGMGGELDEYYRPTIATIANPFQNFNESLKIGSECIAIYNNILALPLTQILEKYAYLMAENEVSLRMVMINTRVQSMITAETQNKKEMADIWIKNIEAGKLTSILDAGMIDGIKSQPMSNVGHSNNITQLIELEQFLKGSLWNELGLQANYNMKRETLNDAELQANTPALKPLITQMLNMRKRGVNAINEKYGTKITVDISDLWKNKEGGGFDESE